MEIKVSLDQKAENMAKLEEMKRKELLKGVIVEEDYATRVILFIKYDLLNNS